MNCDLLFGKRTEAEFLDVIGTKVSGLKLVCNGNIVYGNLKSENSQDCAQKTEQNQNCTFMNSASGGL
jgi:hypothetical protein